MNLSVNQNRQFFAINDKSENLNTAYKGSFFAVAEGEPDIYFQMVGTDGKVRRSDLIPVANILSVRSAKPRADKVHTFTITCPGTSAIQANAGEDYILSVTLSNFIANCIMSPYIKHGVVHATSTLTQTQFAEKLIASLKDSFKRDLNQFVTITDYTASDTTVVLTVASASELNGDTVGVSGVDAPIVVVSGNTVKDVAWITSSTVSESVSDSSPATYKDNVRMVKEIEHFCMGERGDQLRKYGYPMFFKTDMLTDHVTTSYGYCMLDIHYAYVGDNESVQKSEKTLTIAMPADGSSNTEYESLVTRFTTLTGVSVTSYPSA